MTKIQTTRINPLTILAATEYWSLIPLLLLFALRCRHFLSLLSFLSPALVFYCHSVLPSDPLQFPLFLSYHVSAECKGELAIFSTYLMSVLWVQGQVRPAEKLRS